jgi:hypothetical protein
MAYSQKLEPVLRRSASGLYVSVLLQLKFDKNIPAVEAEGLALKLIRNALAKRYKQEELTEQDVASFIHSEEEQALPPAADEIKQSA